MQGYQLTFFTTHDRRHAGLPLGEWLLQEARKLGVAGATLLAASEGFGHDRKLHSAHFIELADQPVEVTMALGEADAERFFQRLRDERVRVFYVKAPIEFGVTGES
jgi:PII-like signaling protein